MHVLDLPQDTFSEIIDALHELPSRNTNVRLRWYGDKTTSQHYFWRKGDNDAIFNLSLVCKVLAEYTSPLRHQLRQQLIDASMGMLENLSQDEPLRWSVRYLTVTRKSFTFESFPRNLAFSSPLPNLHTLDISQDIIDTKLLTWIASCVKLRHLTLRAFQMEQALVPALADLHLLSLQIWFDDHAPAVSLPIQTILSGQSRHSLQKLIIKDLFVRLSTFFPPSIIFHRLKSLYLVRIQSQGERDVLEKLSHSMPNLETLVTDVEYNDIVDPEGSGSWPKLKRVYIKYACHKRSTDYLLINAPMLSEVFLQGTRTFHLRILAQSFSPYKPSNIRVLTLDLTKAIDSPEFPIAIIQDLASGLVHLEVFTLTLTKRLRDFDLSWEQIKFVGTDADSLVTTLKGFRSLRVLDWGVGIPSFGDFVDYLSTEWIKRHTPLYEKLIVSIANVCPRIAEVKWAMSGEKRWVTENVVRGDGGSVSFLDLALIDYNFKDRYADNFPVFTTVV